MSELNEKDIISFLENKINSLKGEIEKAETALSFFGSEDAKNVKEGRKPALSNLNSPAKSNRNTSKKSKKMGSITQPLKKLDVPEHFSETLSRDKQIIYVLSKTPQLNANEVAKEIAGLLNIESDLKLDRTILQRLSALKQNGQIKAKKNGRTSYYSL